MTDPRDGGLFPDIEGAPLIDESPADTAPDEVVEGAEDLPDDVAEGDISVHEPEAEPEET